MQVVPAHEPVHRRWIEGVRQRLDVGNSLPSRSRSRANRPIGMFVMVSSRVNDTPQSSASRLTVVSLERGLRAGKARAAGVVHEIERQLRVAGRSRRR